jgi:Tol biopolymer transport system component
MSTSASAGVSLQAAGVGGELHPDAKRFLSKLPNASCLGYNLCAWRWLLSQRAASFPNLETNVRKTSPLMTLILCLTTLAVSKPAAAEESIESKYLSNVRQVTAGFVRAGEGYFSPDGGTIIYQAVPQEYPFYQIYNQKLDGGKPQLISTGRGRTTCSYFAPDGRHVIFASSHLDPRLSETEEQERQKQAAEARAGTHRRYQWDFDPWMDIFQADADGKNLKQLTTTKGYDAEGAYSPDGKLIAFCSDRGGNPNLYVMNADGSGTRQLTHAKGYNGGPFISPDGKWVVYRSDRKKEGLLQIHAIGIDGQNDTALTDNVGVNWAPYWHPTQPYIIWAGADHSDPQARPNFDLWLMKYQVQEGKIAPAPIARITDQAAADVLPVFSPDGKRLMWTSNRTADHSSQLWIADFRLPSGD